MRIIHPYIFEILKEFPNQRKNILSLHTNSYTFRTMCEDLRKCKEAYQYWDQMRSEEANQRSEEYRNLLVNLETEIREFIESNYASSLDNTRTGN